MGRLKLMNLRRFFLPPLVCVGKVSRGLGLDEDRKAVLARPLRLDHHIDRNIDPERLTHRHVHAKRIGCTLHLLQWSPGRMLLLPVTACVEKVPNHNKLTPLLSVSDNRVRDGAAKAICHDRRRAVALVISRQLMCV